MPLSFTSLMRIAAPAVLLCTLHAAGTTAASAADCTRAVTQAEIDSCFGSNFATADKKLNQIYQQLIKSLQPQEQQMLRDAQRTWVAFRDKHCAFVANPNQGGSIYPSIVDACATKQTVLRSQQLNAKLHCAEGDMGCGS